MDGLECNEILLSYVKQTSSVFRIDSFFYKKEFLKDEYLLSAVPHSFLRDISSPLRSFGAYSLNNDVVYQETGIPFIRGVNMKNGVICFENVLYISDYAHRLLWKSAVFPENILLSMSGSVGEVGIALPTWRYPINSNQDIAKIAVNPHVVSPYYVYVFMRSKFGQNFLIREARGSVQQHVFLSQIEFMSIPRIGKALEAKVANTATLGLALFEEAVSVYQQAKFLLLDALNYQSVEQSENHTTKSFHESFGATRRLDAEYYQPKYDELFHQLSDLPTKRLKNVVGITKSIEPGSEYYGSVGIPFIRVSDVSATGIEEPSIKIPKTTVPSIENLYPQKDTILFSKDGSVGIAYKVESDMEAVTSGALLHLKVKNAAEILPDYLTLLLNSDIVRLQAERDTNGAVIQHWKLSDIEQVIIPILPWGKQQQIAQKIEESFSLRRQSKQLLDNAKYAVEMAIEQGEGQALRWLQEQGKI